LRQDWLWLTECLGELELLALFSIKLGRNGIDDDDGGSGGGGDIA